MSDERREQAVALEEMRRESIHARAIIPTIAPAGNPGRLGELTHIKPYRRISKKDSLTQNSPYREQRGNDESGIEKRVSPGDLEALP